MYAITTVVINVYKTFMEPHQALISKLIFPLKMFIYLPVIIYILY